MDDIESAWSKFCDNDAEDEENFDSVPAITTDTTQITEQNMIPKCSSLNISTKTKISYLNYPIDLKHVFWNIPLIQYHMPCDGIVKKQMKFNSTTHEEVDEITKNKEKYEYVDDYIISQIDNPDGRIKFKDIRKISIGICKKDITSYRCKRKSAFYNCFVVIMRLFHNDSFKEIHVKVFNTGKLEIPGIQDSTILDKVLTLLVKIMTPIVVNNSSIPLSFVENKSETVMINSNFSCGYYINREKMYKLLKYKYKINSNFDPCSYPGIQCEFYYDSLLKDQIGAQPSQERSDNTNSSPVTKVSFMIFRTGSVLIVGKCTEDLLYQIYNFLCDIFEKEYDEIKWISNEPFANKAKDKTRKMRKKVILL
jgi:TATA-box binding protein (TBP) (component of TFIID and TFIIIB)